MNELPQNRQKHFVKRISDPAHNYSIYNQKWIRKQNKW